MIVAVIGAAGAVLAAVLPKLLERRKSRRRHRVSRNGTQSTPQEARGERAPPARRKIVSRLSAQKL